MAEVSTKSIFLAAIEDHQPNHWPAFLDEACAGDVKLRAEVEVLLRSHRRMGTFQEAGGEGIAATMDSTLPRVETGGTIIGPYKLLEQIGEGGMGTVYVAEQMQPIRRKVALKVIKAGMDTAQVVARFEAERQALALMNHPNVAKVLDAGTTAPAEGGYPGRPYFVMELVKGVPITEYCEHHQLDLHQRLELFTTVCQAVHHAHQKGVIHRDLKPSNVLVELHDVRPVPKVIDFGVAKATSHQLTELTLHTGSAQMIGTPLYMSPEQAQLSGMDVDTRSDIYSLGVLLYELLTGTTPFSKEQLSESGFDEMRRIIREDEPLRPSEQVSTLNAAAFSTTTGRSDVTPRQLTHMLRGELDWIAIKALEKDRTRRYETANAFAQDVIRYLSNEPVEAGPPSAVYRLRKFATRNKGSLVSSALLAGALLVGSVGTSWQAVKATYAAQDATREADAARKAEAEARHQEELAVRAREEEKQARQTAEANRAQADQQRDEAERHRYYAEMQLALHDWDGKNVSRLHQTLENYLPDVSRTDRRGWEWMYLFSRCHLDEHTLHGVYGPIRSVAWSPDGALVAAASFDGAAWLWDAKSADLVRTLHSNAIIKYGVAWSPDSRYLAWGGAETVIRIWDRQSDSVRIIETDHKSSLRRLAFSPDGTRLASTSIDKTAKIWDVATGECLHTLVGHTDRVNDLAWHPNSRLVATAGRVAGRPNEGLRVWDTETGTQIHFVEGHAEAVDWRSDGKQVAVARKTGWAVLNTDSWTIDQRHDTPRVVRDLAFSHDGQHIALANEDASVIVYDLRSRQVKQQFFGHLKPVTTIAWDPTDTRLVSADEDGEMKIWNRSARTAPMELATGTAQESITWLNNGRTLASVKRFGMEIKIWNLEDGSLSRTISAPGGAVQISPDGQQLAVITNPNNQAPKKQKSLIVTSLLTGQVVCELPLPSERGFSHLAWSPDGSMLAARENSGDGESRFRLVVWDVARAEVIAEWSAAVQLNCLAWSPDGKSIALGGMGDLDDPNGYTRWQLHLHIIDLTSGIRTFKARTQMVREGGARSVVWSPDGQRVAITNSTGSVAIWEPSTGRVVSRSQAHLASITSMTWSPDNRRLASVGLDGKLVLLNPENGHTVFAVSTSTNDYSQLAWDPTGLRLAQTLPSGTIRVLDASPGHAFFNSEATVDDRARILARRARTHAPLENLTKAIELNPEDPELWSKRAAVLGDREHDWNLALRDADQALLLSPACSRYWFRRGNINVRLGRLQAAALDIGKFAQHNEYYKLLAALAYQAAGNATAAGEMIDEVRRDLSDEDDRSSYRWASAVLRHDQPPPEELLDLAKQAVSEAPSRLVRRLALAATLYRAGRFAEAVSELEQAAPLARATNRHEALACCNCLLAMAHFRLGDVEQTNSLLEEAEKGRQKLADESGFSQYDELEYELALQILYLEATSLMQDGSE